MSRGESPGYPIADAPDDGGVEQWAWVPTEWAATVDEALKFFHERWPDAVEGLTENGFYLVPTGGTAWHRLGPCPSCAGTGADARPRGSNWNVILAGPPEACDSCNGTGEQPEDGNGDYIVWSACQPDDDGAVEFWVLEAVEREPEFDPLGGAARWVGSCSCLAGPGTNPACPVHP